MEIKDTIKIIAMLATLGLSRNTVSATPVGAAYLNGIMKPNHIFMERRCRFTTSGTIFY